MLLGRLPMDPEMAKNCDVGLVELCHTEGLHTAADAVEALEAKQK